MYETLIVKRLNTKTADFFYLMKGFQSNYFKKSHNNNFIFIEKIKNFRQKTDLVFSIWTI